MIRINAIAVLMSLFAALSAGAQSTPTIAASPIPENANGMFCYYAGLAYSETSYIILIGQNNVTQSGGQAEDQLLECVQAEDGTMKWAARAKVRIAN